MTVAPTPSQERKCPSLEFFVIGFGAVGRCLWIQEFIKKHAGITLLRSINIFGSTLYIIKVNILLKKMLRDLE